MQMERIDRKTASRVDTKFNQHAGLKTRPPITALSHRKCRQGHQGNTTPQAATVVATQVPQYYVLYCIRPDLNHTIQAPARRARHLPWPAQFAMDTAAQSQFPAEPGFSSHLMRSVTTPVGKHEPDDLSYLTRA